MTLDVTYNYNGITGVKVDWSKDGKLLVRKFASGGIASANERYFLKGEASLLITNTEPNDNGTFKISLSADGVLSVSEARCLIVIVAGKFFCALMHAMCI